MTSGHGMTGRFLAAAGVALVLALRAQVGWAAGPTKEQCLDAHSRGQDARQSGQLSLASKLFLTCAQPSCPALVQGDCSRFTEELERTQPTVSFAARDASGRDLPDTTVYVDGVLTATRLDDGKLHDLDPGRHDLLFVNGSRQSTMTIVVNVGERGRTVLSTFGGGEARAPGAQQSAAPPASQRHEPVEAKRPLLPLIVTGIGVAVLGAGATLALVGFGKIPSNCSLSSHQCSAPPGDTSFDQAKSSVTMGDVGIGLAATGLAIGVGGLIWYYASPKQTETGSVLLPWATASGGGLSLRGTL